MENLQQDFTTPEFADLLKKYGIEVDTPFVVLMWHEGHYKVALKDSDKGCLDFDGYKHWLEDFSDIKPAYPLTQVLRWLPEKIENEENFGYWLHLGQTLQGAYINEDVGYLANFQLIEALIAQGLTEGWLNKDNLNL